MKKPVAPIRAFKPPTFSEAKPEDLPRDPLENATGWSLKTLEHGQHMFPAAIEATDAEGRSCIYVPMDFAGKIGRWVKAEG